MVSSINRSPHSLVVSVKRLSLGYDASKQLPIENPILCPGDLGEDLKREDFRGQSDVRVDSYASW